VSPPPDRVDLVGPIGDEHFAVDPHIEREPGRVALGGADRVEVEIQTERHPVAERVGGDDRVRRERESEGLEADRPVVEGLFTTELDPHPRRPELERPGRQRQVVVEHRDGVGSPLEDRREKAGRAGPSTQVETKQSRQGAVAGHELQIDDVDVGVGRPVAIIPLGDVHHPSVADEDATGRLGR
jgi:hypothetical protein